MALFRNDYDCDQCENEWTDEWSCACNDKCEVCGAEIEPSHSKQLLYDFEVTTPQFAGDGNWDHHVLWISAKAEDDVHTVLASCGLGPVFAICDLDICPDSKDIDFILPAQADAMRSHIEHLMKECHDNPT